MAQSKKHHHKKRKDKVESQTSTDNVTTVKNTTTENISESPAFKSEVFQHVTVKEQLVNILI